MTQRPTNFAWLQQPMDAPLRIALRVATVPIWLAVSILLSLMVIFLPLRLPRLLGNYVFFAPQYLFDFVRVVRPTDGGFVALFADGTAQFVCAAFWLTVATGHAAITRRWKASHAFVMGLVSVVVAAVLVHLAFSALGYAVQLDGP
jgi:hypothetical protein